MSGLSRSANASSSSEARFILKHVECLHQPEGHWWIRVSIALKDQICIGEAFSATEDCNFEAVSLATTIAINQFRLPMNIQLIDYGQLHSSKSGLSVCAVIIQVIETNNSSHVSGSSMVSLPMLHAPSKAVLNAVNRLLGRYINNS